MLTTVYHFIVSLNSYRAFSSVHFSPLTDWIVGGHEGRFSRDPHPVFSAGGPGEQFWHGQRCPLFGVVYPAFPLPTTASPTLQGVPKDGSGEAVVACDMSESIMQASVS